MKEPVDRIMGFTVQEWLGAFVALGTPEGEASERVRHLFEEVGLTGTGAEIPVGFHPRYLLELARTAQSGPTRVQAFLTSLPSSSRNRLVWLVPELAKLLGQT